VTGVNWVGPADVYVVRSSGGDVLYVGVTGDLRGRLATHKCLSVWWNPTNSIAVETLGLRSDAERREARLIDQLQPRHNEVNWKIWLDRAGEVVEMSRAGSTPKQICSAIGIPHNTVHRILNSARSRGALLSVGQQ
jgi:predicted GIY-YIG superfamily endonuclease